MIRDEIKSKELTLREIHMKATSISIKILATALVLAASTGVAFAKKSYKDEASFKDQPACPPPVMLRDGFYVGAQVGYDSYRVRETVNNPAPAVIGFLTANPVINNTGWVGGLFLGYGQYLTDMFYLGGEIFGNISGASQRWSLNKVGGMFNSKLTTNGSYGLALLPGIRLNDTSLGYIRLDWNWANLKDNNSWVNAAGTVRGGSSRSKTLNGFDFGLGIETLLMANWSVRTEFNHTWYNSFSTASTKYSASDNQFMLGLLYHFS